MKVVLDLSPLDTPSRLRGIGQYTLGLTGGILELQRNGELDLELGGIARYDFRGNGACDIELGYQGTPTHPDGFNDLAYRMRKRLGVARAALKAGASLLHVTEPIGVPWGNLVPYVVTCHDLIPLRLHRDYLPSYPGARAIRFLRDRRRYRSASRVIAVSHSTKRDLVELLGIDAGRIDVAHLGVDAARFSPLPNHDGEAAELRHRYGLDKPVLLYVGAYDPRKSIAGLVQAFANSGLARDFDLVLGGAIREMYRKPLARLITSLHLDESVRFLGFVPDGDLAPLYRSCLAHVFPSTYEGFGLPVIEALACGAPTLACNASSIPEVAGDAALLVPPGNLEALTEALSLLGRDEALRARLRAAGPLQAQKFTWQSCARQTLSAYRAALRSP